MDVGNMNGWSMDKWKNVLVTSFKQFAMQLVTIETDVPGPIVNEFTKTWTRQTGKASIGP